MSEVRYVVTRAQVAALRMLSDGKEHETTTSTRERGGGAPGYVGGPCVRGLVRRGWATLRGAWPSLVCITPLGLEVFAVLKARSWKLKP